MGENGNEKVANMVQFITLRLLIQFMLRGTLGLGLLVLASVSISAAFLFMRVQPAVELPDAPVIASQRQEVESARIAAPLTKLPTLL